MTSFGEAICLSDLQFLTGQAECFMSAEGLLILEQNSSELQYPSIAVHLGDSGQEIEIFGASLWVSAK